MLRIVEIEEAHDADIFGGKAAGLALLKENGYQIPDGIAIETCRNEENINDELMKALSEMVHRFAYKEKYKVAVRSSATIEDTFCKSMSGYFATVIGELSFEELLKALKKVIRSLDEAQFADGKMGVIIQRKIDADYSGVIYSSNPLTYCKSEMIISVVEGIGDKLVSGADDGLDIFVSVSDGTFQMDENRNAFASKEILEALCSAIKNLERKLGYPIDVEWAVKENELYFLQCRPLASITKVQDELIYVRRCIPEGAEQFIGTGKLKLWHTLLQNNIMFPDIWIYVHNLSANEKSSISVMSKSEKCKGYSTVVVYPHQYAEDIPNLFLGDKTKVLGHVSGCCRYGIRSFPKYGNIEECIGGFRQIINEKYWVGCFMVQEVYDPVYTGVLQKLEDGYLIELTRGCFVTKGISATSRYVLTDERISARDEQRQTTWYKVIEGHVLYCVCNENTDSLVSLQDEELFFLIWYFKPILNAFSASIEFGIMREQESGKIAPYFIDLSDEDTLKGITSSEVNAGILSRGKAAGKIKYLDLDCIGTVDTNVETVFFCSRPDISLKKLIERCNPQKIGFVFEKGSFLCHLASLLREKHIPAIQIGEFHRIKYPEGEKCIVDADAGKIACKEKVKILSE